jgi:hypothetical protein
VNITTKSFKVVVRSVEGLDAQHSAADAESALKVAQSVRTPANRMVKIFDDGFVTHRWDRTNTPGENRWRKVDPGEMEILGHPAVITYGSQVRRTS